MEAPWDPDRFVLGLVTLKCKEEGLFLLHLSTPDLDYLKGSELYEALTLLRSQGPSRF